ncbi:hypothetical protein BR93DRAFT_886957 [Coniochaeta sp. PMI_546]|nr:hypothetical protein BR93DRAFT_886957 [Coniochaeta sp. PMI_546]
MIVPCCFPSVFAIVEVRLQHHRGRLVRIVLGLKAIALGLVAQLLMFGLEMATELSPFPFPSSILAMFLLFVLLLLLGCCWDGLEDFYAKHLRQPTNLVNRHMSIGFSIPIVMLARSPVASGDTIARIIACFVTAGVVSTTAVYLMAACSQEILSSCARHSPLHRRCGRLGDEEASFPPKNERSTGRILDRDDVEGPAVGCASVAPADDFDRPSSWRGEDWVLDHPLLISSWFFTLVIGIPLRYGAGFEEPLGISLLLAIWTTTQALQTSIRTSTFPVLQPLRPKARIVLSVTCNPVLWTAMGLLAYAAAESHRSSRDMEVVLSTLERNTTFTDLVMHRSHPDSGPYLDFGFSSRDSSSPDYAHRPHPGVAAGDVANAILSAGLVCWGLKLWEYRRRLLSSAGFTILVVSCTAALANVILGPLLAKEVLGPHSQARYDLAFVARTVTLALGAPAVARIGGDVGLSAAMAVVNGIMCQMLLGLGAGESLARLMEMAEAKIGKLRQKTTLHWKSIQNGGLGSNTTQKGAESSNNTQGDAATGHDFRQSTTAPENAARVVDGSHDTTPSTSTPTPQENTTRIIASGVTIGINAAAMGTAHLYEGGSDAAPYSALAMTVFGVATVGFTMIPQLGGWVVARVQ